MSVFSLHMIDCTHQPIHQKQTRAHGRTNSLGIRNDTGTDNRYISPYTFISGQYHTKLYQ